MTKKEKQHLLKDMKRLIIETDKMFSEKDVSHAYIIGYLQGGIKSHIERIENSIKQ